MINCLKEGVFEINEKSINSDRDEAGQELMLLQDFKLQEWYQGDLQVLTAKEVKEAIRKELVSLSNSGREVYDPVPVRLLLQEEQSNIIESRWVIGPRSGVLKARFVGRASLKSSIQSPSMLTHVRQRLPSSFSWWIRPTEGILQFQMLLWRFSAHQWTSQKAHLRSGVSGDSVSWANHLETQASALWPSVFTNIVAGSHDASAQKTNLVQIKSDPCSAIGRDSSGKVSIIAMA